MPLKKYRNQKSLKEDFKYLKPIFQMRTRPKKFDKYFVQYKKTSQQSIVDKYPLSDLFQSKKAKYPKVGVK